ncbi:MAG TPA: vWA domain-containing protein [Negativicutes bacterium]|nr:vWA domain-containing protein [Negativicutes bacterium]
MPSNIKKEYYVDLTFCIDATQSMHNVIEIVKKNALNFYQDVMAAMAEKDKTIARMRISIIAFRDYKYDHEDAMLQTDFFTLPDDAVLFRNIVTGIEANGGGDDPEDGLEALAHAIRSDWDRSQGKKHRQVIVVWTDAATHELGFGACDSNYPSGLPRDFGELTRWWENEEYINSNEKRLVIFAPDAPYWNTISDNWDNVIHFQSIAGQGLMDVDYAQIIEAISNSI